MARIKIKDIMGTDRTYETEKVSFRDADREGEFVEFTEGPGGAEVVPLSVTENGVYNAPSGQAYSPVIVTVSGGSSEEVPENDVVFIDYDGRIVYSYSAQDFLALTEMPPNPEHDGLTAQGWNWSLADAKAYVAETGMHVIGQMYITTDGDTKLHIVVPDTAREIPLSLTMQNVSSSVQINWGDGSEKTTVVPASSSKLNITSMHRFARVGECTVSIRPLAGSFTFYSDGQNNPGIFSKINGTGQENRFRHIVKEVNIGSAFYVSNYAFAGNVDMQKISIPANTAMTGGNGSTFCNNMALRCLILPPTFTSVPLQFAYYCSGIEWVSFPETTRTIQGSAFYECKSLRRVALPAYTTGNGQIFYSPNAPTALSIAAIPSGVTRIYNAMFGGSCIARLSFPATVTRIDANGIPSNDMFCARLNSTTPPTLANSLVMLQTIVAEIPFSAIASYLSTTNYPALTGRVAYIGFAEFASGAALPTQDPTAAYNATWYATESDAYNKTNPITVGTGEEVYCRFTAA